MIEKNKENKNSTIGSSLLPILEEYGVDIIFGIPGVHTVEIYRGLQKTSIKHITPRHEQGAGFMADGYSRVSGKPAVCLVITGPGLTNILTAMAQARADSIPMLIISSVNPYDNKRKHSGLLHELPHQQKLLKKIAISSLTVKKTKDLIPAIKKSFLKMLEERPGPVHIEIPTNVLNYEYQKLKKNNLCIKKKKIKSSEKKINEVSNYLTHAKYPVLLLGGGARGCDEYILKIVEKLSPYVITTINARGILGDHSMCIPASPTLKTVRKELKKADIVLAVGTEFGETDYDMYKDGNFPKLKKLIRVDINKNQLTKNIQPYLSIRSDAIYFFKKLSEILLVKKHYKKSSLQTPQTAKIIRKLCLKEIEPKFKVPLNLISTISSNFPDAILVGDSTQPTYAGNLYTKTSKQGKWFNSATGYGTLGYAPPASIGAKLAKPNKPVICIVGDGGLQFSLSELMTASEEKIAVIFLIWNNFGYKEIKDFMVAENVNPIGVDIKPPNLKIQAAAFNLQYYGLINRNNLVKTLKKTIREEKPSILEICENEY
jgi:acetolactate synthase-1/2/3 large subunit